MKWFLTLVLSLALVAPLAGQTFEEDYEAAVAASRSGKHLDAAVMFAEILERYPNATPEQRGKTHVSRVNALLDVRDYDGVLPAAQATIAEANLSDSTYLHVQLYVGLYFRNRGKDDEGLRVLNEALTAYPQAGNRIKAWVHGVIGDFHSNMQKADLAEQAYRTMLDFYESTEGFGPNNLLAKSVNVGNAIGAQSDWPRAVTYIQGRLLAWAPTEADALKTPADVRRAKIGLWYFLIEAGDVQGARTAWVDMLVSTRNLPWDHQITAVDILTRAGVPYNDPAMIAFVEPQELLDRMKGEARADGRIDDQEKEALVVAARQLSEGGPDGPFVRDPAVTAMAEAIPDDVNLHPDNRWIRLLWLGQWDAAAKYAWTQAKEAADDDAIYTAWCERVAASIRCRDQHYNGLARDFLRWLNLDPEVPDNPLADLLQ